MAFEIVGDCKTYQIKGLKRFELNHNQGFIEDICLDDDLQFIRGNLSCIKDETFKVRGVGKHFIFTYLLSGNTTYISNQTTKVSTPKDFLTISMEAHSQGLKKFYKNQNFQSVQLILGEKYLKNILQDNFKNHKILDNFYENDFFWKWIKTEKINPLSKINLFEILNTPINEDLNSLIIKSKILELLHVEFKTLLNSEKKEQKVRFSQDDKEALYKAREILYNNFKSPPSIQELAKKVHLNEFKLKVGFRQFFQSSIYGFVILRRMKEAKKLLLCGEYNINEVAQIVGYKYTCNFSIAFKKHFNINPKEILKTTKYY